MPNNILNGWRRVINRILFITLIVYLLIICVPVIASAIYINNKWTCGSTQELYKGLTGVGETLVSTGIVGDNVFYMSLWANSATGTWTIIASMYKEPATSCIVLDGSRFQTQKARILSNSI
jgi:hypothetical protein